MSRSRPKNVRNGRLTDGGNARLSCVNICFHRPCFDEQLCHGAPLFGSVECRRTYPTFPYRLFRNISYPFRSSVIPMSSECAGRKPVRSIFAFETM